MNKRRRYKAKRRRAEQRLVAQVRQRLQSLKTAWYRVDAIVAAAGMKNLGT